MKKDRKEVNPKKVAAKRRFRNQLYKGPKQQLKEQTQTKVIHAYKKVLRKEEKDLTKWQSKLEKIYAEDEEGEEGEKRRLPQPETSSQDPKSWSVGKKQTKKVSSLHKSEQKWKEKRDNLDKQSMEKQRIADEKKAALEKYGKKKREGHKKRAKRNYKGQPIMASQVDLLLSKLQKSKP